MNINKVFINLSEIEISLLNNFFVNNTRFDSFSKTFNDSNYCFTIYFDCIPAPLSAKGIEIKLFISKNNDDLRMHSTEVFSMKEIKYICFKDYENNLYTIETNSVLKPQFKSYEEFQRNCFCLTFSNINHFAILFSIISFSDKEELLFFNEFLCSNFLDLVLDNSIKEYLANLILNKFYYYGYQCLEKDIGGYEILFGNDKLSVEDRASSLTICLLENFLNNEPQTGYKKAKIINLFNKLKL